MSHARLFPLLFVGCATAAVPQAAPPSGPAAAQAAVTRAAAAPPSRWCLHQANDGAGGLVVLTLDHGYDGFAAIARYPWLVSVRIEIGERNPAGLPTPAEGEVLNQVEDRVTAELAALADVQPVGRATMAGIRELLYYASDGAKADAAMAAITAEAHARPFEYLISEDPGWSHVLPLFADPGDCD